MAYIEEARAANEIEALKQGLAPQARVRRERVIETVGSVSLVPGDVLLLRQGDVVPADCCLCSFDSEATGDADESMLTGESLPVSKVPGDVLFSSSIVSRGEMLPCVVVSTGVNTRWDAKV